MIRIEEYITETGASPFERWFEALGSQAAAIVTTAIERLSDGNLSNVKSVGEGVSELRIDRGPESGLLWLGRPHFGDPSRRRDEAATAGRYRRSVAALAGLQDSQVGQEIVSMPLTRNFKETVRARAERDASFRQALLGEAIQSLLDGDLESGRAALRSCINATIGFERLGRKLDRSSKSLMRMFGPSGNPTTENLLAVIGALQTETGVHLEVYAVTRAA